MKDKVSVLQNTLSVIVGMQPASARSIAANIAVRARDCRPCQEHIERSTTAASCFLPLMICWCCNLKPACRICSESLSFLRKNAAL